MAIESRSGETENIPFRTGRFYNIDSKWYFASREQADVGPYESKQAAEQALTIYLLDTSNLSIASYAKR